MGLDNPAASSMLVLVRLAWRNIFRCGRRTLLSALAIGLGMAALIFTDAFTIGMEESVIRTATDTFLGQGQIHAEGFRSTYEVERTVRNRETLLAALGRDPQVASFAPRSLTYGMLTSAANVGSVLLCGIDPVREREVSKIDEAIVRGTYLEAGIAGRMLVGTKLAETLEVGLDDRLVVTVAQAGSGALAQEMFRVGGIFHFNVRDMDAGVVFVDLGAAQELSGLGAEVHEIALHFDDIAMAGDPELELWRRYGRGGNEILGWKELLPALDAVLEMSNLSMLILGIILFAVVALTIVNTLLMSLYERMFEFGILRAMGTRPGRLALLILLEVASLALVSIAVGSALGLAATGIFAEYGIDYVGIEMAGVTLRELIYPVAAARQFVVFPLMVLAFALVAGIYPAVLAARVEPVEAMRKGF